jgi:hypothetical protein
MARLFVIGMPFEPSPMFANKVTLWQVLGLTKKTLELARKDFQRQTLCLS